MNARALFPGEWLVCFAVKEEAVGFVDRDRDTVTLITGMGRANAERTIRAAIQQTKPALVLTCGFAGGLDPNLAKGTVLFASDSDIRLQPFLVAAGAKAARIHCVDRVAVTAVEKRALRQSAGADAVEMESQYICAVCRDQGIPSATVRVILDTAEEDLPLDFNQVMTSDYRINFLKLSLFLLKSPGKIKSLLQLQRDGRQAAAALGKVLTHLAQAS